MARDEGEKPSKRRWGRGRDEEGPSEEDLGWLADLRGGAPRDDRGDEPTGGYGRGRRFAHFVGRMGSKVSWNRDCRVRWSVGALGRVFDPGSGRLPNRE